jgi:hypothetical protein
MKRIKKFGDFDDLDFISESRVYFLRDLTVKLGELYNDGNEWAFKLLKAQGKNIDSDTTFLNFEGEDFSFSKESDLRSVLRRFMTEEDIEKFFRDITNKELFFSPLLSNYLGSYEQTQIQNLTNRGKAKMGRIIKKLLPEIPDKDLEQLVNSLRSEQVGYEIKLVKGDDIAKYYKKESCDRKMLNYGTLQSSCMMDKADERPHIFDIYTKNPEVCQLAVMLNKDGKLVGRALVWKIDEIGRKEVIDNNGSKYDVFYSKFDAEWEKQQHSYINFQKAKVKDIYFMDRVYYTKDWINNSFQKWAKENNFMIKIGSSIDYKNSTAYPIMFCKINKLGYRQFPYMDTFKNYDVQSGTLCNYEIPERGFELASVIGDYRAKGTSGEKAIDKATNYIRRFKDYLK